MRSFAVYALRASASLLDMTDHPWSASHFFYKVRPCTLPKGQLKLFHIYPVNIGQQLKEVTKTKWSGTILNLRSKA
tara:strand:- start:9451 stop:9678 length:228 start_codon:yes stop_codon:yes gene_type:complete